MHSKCDVSDVQIWWLYQYITICLKQLLFKVQKTAEACCFELDPKSAILEAWRIQGL